MNNEILGNSTEFIQKRVYLTPDEEGYIGRKCKSCGEYFKIVSATKSFKDLMCPYCECGYKSDVNEFFTQDQAEYAKSVAASEVFTEFVKDLRKSLKSNNFKPSNNPIKFSIKHYKEEILDTEVVCDNCGLKFSIYGVFSNCPYCGQLNAKVIFDKSIESLLRKLDSCKDENLDISDKDDHKRNTLIGGVSAFDALGKPLRVKYNNIIPASMPKNLFQDLGKLNKVLYNKCGKNIADYISQDNFEFLYKMFQVRHIYDHNAGVIDDDFVKNMARYDRSYQLGRKYPLTVEEIEKFLHIVQDLGNKIFYEFEKTQENEECNS